MADGTLFAVWSSPDTPLTYKAAGTELLMAYDLSLEALPADSVTIVSTATGLNLTMAAPLAAQASALLADMMRGVRQDDQLDALSKQQKVVGQLLVSLTDRMKEAETQQAKDRESLLIAVAANAAAVINLQNLVVQKKSRSVINHES